MVNQQAKLCRNTRFLLHHYHLLLPFALRLQFLPSLVSAQLVLDDNICTDSRDDLHITDDMFKAVDAFLIANSFGYVTSNHQHFKLRNSTLKRIAVSFSTCFDASSYRFTSRGEAEAVARHLSLRHVDDGVLVSATHHRNRFMSRGGAEAVARRRSLRHVDKGVLVSGTNITVYAPDEADSVIRNGFTVVGADEMDSTGVRTLQNSCFGSQRVKGWNLRILPTVKENEEGKDEKEREREEKPFKVKSRFLKARTPILIATLVSVSLVISIICFWVGRKKPRKDDSNLVVALKALPGMPREFRYKELKRGTDNFDMRNKLGQGGFGTVYKGTLHGDGSMSTEVAVKTFSREKGHVDFLAELTIINRLRHRHLVRLIGWCYKYGKLLLVYEFMPNGSLDKHLFNVPPGTVLPWHQRYNILAGVAAALRYLHDEYEQVVVHRDLKASNIMLDSNFNARLGDFGLARTIAIEHSSYDEMELDGMPGTWGYIAPECLYTGKSTCQSDMYGFGTVILEVVCGRRPTAEVDGFGLLVDWVWKLYREGRILEAVDHRLQQEYVAEEAKRLLLVGLACNHPIMEERPKAEVVMQVISEVTPPPVVPLLKPAFLWPTNHTSKMHANDSGTNLPSPCCSSSPTTSAAYYSAYKCEP